MQGAPLISVIMPNLNTGRFLAQAIESVLSQNGPRSELIVIDGGSSDCSQEILESYKDRIDVLIVEPDQGQADAIMKGAIVARGLLLNWINSDDILLPGALSTVANGIGTADCFAGAVQNMDEAGNSIEVVMQRRLTAEGILRHPWRGSSYHQPGVWLRRERFLGCGGLDRSLHFAFDREMMIRYLACSALVRITDRPLAGFRLHPTSKTVSQASSFIEEQRRTLRRLAESGPKPLRRLALTHMERLNWWSELEQMARSADRENRLTCAALIVRRVASRPRVRAGRAAARTLVRVLTNRV